MELNNKYGTCCKCPAIMDDSRLFTSYMPHKDYNNKLMAKFNVTNNNDYKTYLQTNGTSIKTDILNKLESGAKCTNNGNNKFYQRIDINKYFEQKLVETMEKPSELFPN